MTRDEARRIAANVAKLPEFFSEAVERVILMLNLLIRRSRLGRFWSQADMQMVVSANQTGGNDPTATSAVPIEGANLSRFDAMALEGSMKRREFITALGVAATWPFTARAQQPGRVYRLGSLHTSLRTAPYHLAFYEALREQGFIEGQNLSVDERGYGLRADQYREHVLELVAAQVDVIVCAGDLAMKIAREATTW
jgi:hypothetical protein